MHGGQPLFAAKGDDRPSAELFYESGVAEFGLPIAYRVVLRVKRTEIIHDMPERQQ